MSVLSNVLIIPFILAFGFSPYLIGVNVLTRGRSKGYAILALLTFTMIFLLGGASESSSLVQLFMTIVLGSFLIATIGLAEVVRRSRHPMFALTFVPMGILLFVMAIIIGYGVVGEVSIQQQLVDQVVKAQPEMIKFFEQAELNESQDYFELKALVMKPEDLVSRFVTYGMGSYFDFIMLALWINLFFLLRAYRLMEGQKHVSYSEFTLLNLKMHSGLKWALLVSGIFYLGADYFSITALTAISFVFLNILGAFYFFQGFGVYLRFLDFVRIYGFIRVFLIVLTIFSARPILVLVGFADEFINFRKLMTKKDQGEM